MTYKPVTPVAYKMCLYININMYHNYLVILSGKYELLYAHINSV